jgi:hypothetical protein
MVENKQDRARLQNSLTAIRHGLSAIILSVLRRRSLPESTHREISPARILQEDPTTDGGLGRGQSRCFFNDRGGLDVFATAVALRRCGCLVLSGCGTGTVRNRGEHLRPIRVFNTTCHRCAGHALRRDAPWITKVGTLVASLPSCSSTFHYPSSQTPSCYRLIGRVNGAASTRNELCPGLEQESP